MNDAMIPFELENEEGLRLRGLDFGATLTSLTLPVAGSRREVLLGCADEAYPAQQVWLGAVAGRFANRIGNAELLRDGQRWPLDANQPPHCLHGGRAGFHRQHWQIKEREADRVRLTLLSRSGDQGFPGNLRVMLEYRLEQCDLVVDFVASTDAPTPVSLTSHTYFNLDDNPNGGDVRGHLIRLNADRFLPTDQSSLPLAIAPVEGPFDLRHERLIGQDWLSHPQQQQAKGYDHAFVLNGPSAEWAARVVSGDRQLAMEVYTNQPSLQFYSGNWLANTPARDGRRHRDHAGFCLEAQQLPDSPNRPELGDPWLLPGQTYRHQTRYRFIAAS
ncbi:galactose-1-epimerase [Aeromonas sp. FDAARGOS 1403]|uniref:galactose-1-epimerase n=1 Tax=Aeromonas TaxID=642 RepID=UPI001C23EA0A|nr:galactose-1-epimerase [Aeromonas sp. FDAARGOS 1403]QXA16202.1 galactose-1-epimerase [Aeromonas sp. FDAARGOS 1403]